MGLCAIASFFDLRRVGLANPCMGSFVGRGATATHCTTIVWSRYDKPLGNRHKMTDFGGQLMKLKSLILGSVFAAGLSTAGYAADLGVLTSLDVCDELGLSGLTISSDTNCLQISGGVEYEFNWGDFQIGGDTGLDAFTPIGAYTGDDIDVPVGNDLLDWESDMEAWLKFVGTASSDFGPASATLRLLSEDEEADFDDEDDDSNDEGFSSNIKIDEAYVSIGDTTVIMAGKKGSIKNEGDDEPFNYLGLFNSQGVDDPGVWFADGDYFGGHVIQVVSDLGNGLSVGVGLENLDGGNAALDSRDDEDDPVDEEEPDLGETGIDDEGTVVGVVSYAGSNITAHLTGAAIGVLDGDVEQYAVHAGATGTFDMFKVRGAFGYNRIEDIGGEDLDIFNGLLSAEASFDMFTVAVSGEYAYSDLTGLEGYGIGGSIGAGITEGISLNLGGRYFNNDDIDGGDEDDVWQVEAQLVSELSESLSVIGALGVIGGDEVEEDPLIDDDQVYYGAAELAWAPGGGFSSSVRGEVNSSDAYKVTFKAAKSFE
jgi:hypothetical protein